MDRKYSLEGLKEMCGDDQDFINEMIGVFLDNNLKYLESANEAFSQSDWKSLKSNVHKIKPSILLMRIDSLKEAILNLNEFSGQEINIEKIPDLMELLNNDLNEVFDQMKKDFNL